MNEFDTEDVDGIIRSPSIYPPALLCEVGLCREISDKNTPVLFVDRPLTLKGVSSVGFNDIVAMEKVFDHIWEFGFRNIHFVYPEVMNVNMRNAERAEGFRRAASRRSYDPEGKYLVGNLVDEKTSADLIRTT